MKRLVLPIMLCFVFLATVGPARAQTNRPAVFPHGLVVTGDVAVVGGNITIRVGTNDLPVLRHGDVTDAAPLVDGFSIVTNSNGRISLPARYDLNDAMLAWRLAMLEGFSAGMVDAWYWAPVSSNGLAYFAPGVLIHSTGILNYGRSAVGVSFGGAAHAVSATNVPLSGGVYSIQAWVRKDNPHSGGFFAAGVGTWDGHAQGVAIVGVGSSWQLSQWDLQLTWTGEDPMVGAWTHAVGVVSNGHGALYINGVEVASCTACFDGAATAPAPLRIGRAPDGWGGLVGAVDEVAFFNRALTGSEVADLYNYGLGLRLTTNHSVAAGALGIWNLDEGDGATSADSGGFGNHLALVGAGWSEGAVGTLEIFDVAIISETIEAAVQPSHARAVVMVHGLDGRVADTNLSLAVSRDGGVSWDNAALAEERVIAGAMQLFSGTCSLTNQPAGTSIVFKVDIPDSHALTVRGFGGSWR